MSARTHTSQHTARVRRTRGATRRRVRSSKAMGLAEILVAMTLFGVVSTLLLGYAVSTALITERTQNDADSAEESRLAVQRLGRELRQAKAVSSVDLVDAGDTTNSMTLEVDFNGNGVIEEATWDPEVVTYRWNPDNGNLTLTANDADGDSVTRPVLAGGVEDFDIRLRSSHWEYDTNGDGITTWNELDASVVGNRDSSPAGELDHIDIVSVRMTVAEGDVSKTFTVQSDLRNQHTD